MDLRFNNSLKRVIVVEKDSSGEFTSRKIYDSDDRSTKKGTAGLNQVEKVVQRLISSHQAFVDEYLDLHNKSNRKKKDGWVRDFPYNIVKANEEAIDALRR